MAWQLVLASPAINSEDVPAQCALYIYDSGWDNVDS